MITGIVGWPGAGKTYTATLRTLQDFRAAAKRQEYRQVYTNMAGLRCPEAIYLDSMEELAEIGNGLVLLDEAGVFLSSRYWQSVPRSVLMALAQVRKNGLDMIWVTQHESRIDTVLRELTSSIVRCRRVGKWSIQAECDAVANKVIGRKVVRLSKEVFDLYDTLEIIGIGGGSEGRGAAAQSRAARRREAAAAARLLRDQQRNAVKLLQWWDKCGSLSREAAAAAEYLQSIGLEVTGSDWQEKLRSELARRRWLAVWGLQPDDAPDDCTPSSPWLLNHSPRDAQLRREAMQEIEKLQALHLERSKKKK